MTGGETPATSLREDLAAGFEATSGSDAPPPVDGLDGAPPPVEGAPPAAPDPAAPPIPAELPPLEAPPIWGQKYRDAFGRFAANPEYRELLTQWQDHWKESQGYITKRDQEFAEFRRQTEPLLQTVQPYAQYWAQQGMTPQQGITQVLSYAEALAQNPAAMIPQLAQMYGVDLAALVAEQPYVDPEVAALKQQLAELQQAQQTSVQQQMQAQQHRIAQEIQAFQSAVDEKGQPKYPHFDRVFDKMLGLAQAKMAQNVEQAYEMALRLDPELQAEMANQRALQEAATRAADAKRAMDASKTVQGKSVTSGQPPATTLREDLAQGLAQLGLT